MDQAVDTSGFRTLAPAGHYVALRVGFAFPMFEDNRFPKQWVERYQARGLLMNDPVMHWMFQNTGVCRWSRIDIDDPRGVMTQAKRFGLEFGVAICCADTTASGQRSFGSFGRGDREFESSEIETLHAMLQLAHDRMVPPKNLTVAELEALGLVKNGHLMKEIANMLGVSEGAVKQRLKNAKSKLNAKTSTQAATLATTFGLI